MILEFYKQIFTDMPDLIDNLKEEYDGSINDCINSEDNDDCPSEDEKKELLKVDILNLLMKMTKNDMK